MTAAAPEPAAVGFGVPAEPEVGAEPAVEAEQAAVGVEPVDWGLRLPAEAVRRPRKTGHRRQVGFHN